MHPSQFLKLQLKQGDYIWITNERGERFGGIYQGQYNSGNQTFKFQNGSNGQTETAEIQKLQGLTRGVK